MFNKTTNAVNDGSDYSICFSSGLFVYQNNLNVLNIYSEHVGAW